jgi:hypothetical protein
MSKVTVKYNTEHSRWDFYYTDGKKYSAVWVDFARDEKFNASAIAKWINILLEYENNTHTSNLYIRYFSEKG